MNQILSSQQTTTDTSKKALSIQKQKSKFFKIQFIFCTIFAFVTTGYYAYLQYDKKQKEQLSKEILERLNITRLYDDTNSDYSSLRLVNENHYQTEGFGFSVIGLIEIKSLGINYPIINEFNYELLKIAPCKFFGPNPNQIRQYLYCWS
ncbi:MAG: hypothetical protein HFJ27_03800 [Clostridia bacterium]|nr:hypothetical protein [Clostridia bacterium]